MSTTTKGDEFRDEIASLLRAAQFYNVSTEKLIKYKKVDVYFEEGGSFSSKIIRTVIECKNYSLPLTKEKIKKDIFPDYFPLINNSDVDKVIIISIQPLGAAAQSYVTEIGFDFLTYSEFKSKLMDFKFYLSGIRAQYSEGGLSKYYIKPKIEGNIDLENFVNNWLSKENTKPIAILAGYGMGKTSFARHMASVLAETHAQSSEHRIPILIKLGEISSEQSLDGLISKVLANQEGVVRFNFSLFMELNRLGLFVIILDGFDEMKHTITWEQFKYNFKEINRLLEGNSKVLLLGRPSAFMSDIEQTDIIRGVKRINDKEIKSFEWQEYERVDLLPFGEVEAYDFIERYLRYALTNSKKDSGLDIEEFIHHRISEIKSLNYSELIKRPVQARMLTEIACQENFKLKELSRYELYDLFISLIIKRELEKPSRLFFSEQSRREFIKEIAWWLWLSGGTSGFSASEVPSSITEKFVNDKCDDKTAVLRDLISGSILETKTANNFYFPHRSFQEFLVSEYISNQNWNTSDLESINKAFNDEIFTFIREGVVTETLSNLPKLAESYSGALRTHFIDFLAWIKNTINELPNDNGDPHISPWGVAISYFQKLAHYGAPVTDVSPLKFITNTFSKAINSDSKLMCILTLLHAYQTSPHEETKLDVLKFILGLTLVESIPRIEDIMKMPHKQKSFAMDYESENIFMLILVKSVSISGKDVEKLELNLDLDDLFIRIKNEIHPIMIDELDSDLKFGYFHIPYTELFSVSEILRFTKKGGLITKYFKNYHSVKNVVSVQRKEKRYQNLPDWARDK